MKTEEKQTQEDALLLIHSRNAFYHQKYQTILGIFILSIFADIILVCMLVFLINHPNKPLFFPADQIGRLIPYSSLQVPHYSLAEVTAWAKEAVETAYSYDFMEYRAELQNAQKYFTDFGWRNYMNGLEASNNLKALTDRHLVGIAKVIEPPKLIKEGLLGGAYAWKFEMRVLLTYLTPPYDMNDPKSKFSNALKITLLVQRQNILQSYQGLGIVQIIGTLA